VADAAWLTQVRKGLLELCILNLLARESMYGYQIVKLLTDIPGLVISEGTVYPLLSRLKSDGLITDTLVESPHGPVRRTYVLTAVGRKQMRAMNEAWLQIDEAVRKLIAGEGP